MQHGQAGTHPGGDKGQCHNSPSVSGKTVEGGEDTGLLPDSPLCRGHRIVSSVPFINVLLEGKSASLEIFSDYSLMSLQVSSIHGDNLLFEGKKC